jgi:hypothetical protein
MSTAGKAFVWMASTPSLVSARRLGRHANNPTYLTYPTHRTNPTNHHNHHNHRNHHTIPHSRFGTNCDVQEDACAAQPKNPCKNKGICFSDKGSWACKCPLGWVRILLPLRTLLTLLNLLSLLILLILLPC